MSERARGARASQTRIALMTGAVVLALGAHASSTGRAASLLLTDARLVDPAARTETVGSLLLRDGVVVARGAQDGTDLRHLAPDATEVALSGRWLVPALVDLRVHAGENRSPGHRDRLGAAGTARVLAGAGVTLYADVHLVREGREWRSERGDGPGLRARPRIGGPVITAPGGRGADHPGALTVFTPAQAVAALDSLVTRSPPADLVTVILDRRPPSRPLPPAAVRALVEGAARRSMPCVVEVGTWEDVSTALEAGATVLCHVPPVPLPEQLEALIGRARPAWIPTLAVALDFRQLIQDEQLRADALLRRVAPVVLVEDYGMVRVPQTRFAEGRALQGILFANVQSLDVLGVRWLAGSDSGAIGTFHGWSLVREMQWMHAAGVEVWEVLRAATVSAAALLGERRGFEVGMRGDYLVLDRDPVEDLRAVAAASAVVVGGEIVAPASILEAVLREVVEQAPPEPLGGLGTGALVVILALLFTFLLVLRTVVRRAAREPGTEPGD